MLFALICTDKQNHLQVRLDTRAAHLQWLTGLGGAVKAAGPFLSGDGKPSGTLAIVEAEDIEAARRLAAKDPYAVAGLFASVDIRPWSWVVKNPENA
jgi:uncharacterized protein